MASAGTCGFGTKGVGPMPGYKVGNEDIINLINSAIAKYAKNWKVGATGSMSCQNIVGGGHSKADWRIVHA